MGMFERLGESVEKFKQEAVAARDERVEYRCRACGDESYTEHDSCPACGSTDLERVDAEA